MMITELIIMIIKLVIALLVPHKNRSILDKVIDVDSLWDAFICYTARRVVISAVPVPIISS